MSSPNFSLGISQDIECEKKKRNENKVDEKQEKNQAHDRHLEENQTHDKQLEENLIDLEENQALDKQPKKNWASLESTYKNEAYEARGQVVKLKLKNPSIYEKSPYVERCLDARSIPTATEICFTKFILENDLKAL